MIIIEKINYTAPAKDTGGVERFVEHLSRSLTRKGHDVKLFINKDSKSDIAEVIDKLPRSYDIIHFHGDCPDEHGMVLPSNKWMATCHSGPPPLPHEIAKETKYNPNYIGVSQAVCNMRGFSSFIHNGVEPGEFYTSPKEDYYLWIGGTDWAEQKALFSTIFLAKKLNINLIVAGAGKDRQVIDELNRLCTGKVRYVGIVNGKEKLDLISKAIASFMIGTVHDACPLSSIEAQMCGTPVIARPAGAHPEMIRNGVNGFICNNEQEIVKAILKSRQIDKDKCRQYAIEKFSIDVCADNYIKKFQEIISRK